MTAHTWTPEAEGADPSALCAGCGHAFIAHYDEHQPGCLGLHLCRCDPAPTTGCAHCDQGFPPARATEGGGR